VAKGRAHSYLKDQRALEDYLIDQGLVDAVLVAGDGTERAGRDLRDIVEQARQIAGGINGLHSRYNRDVVEQGAIGGVFDATILNSPSTEKAAAIADLIAKRLDSISEEMETGWEGRYGNDGYVFKREVRGVTEVHVLDRALLGSLDARKLNERHGHLVEVYDTPAKLKRKDKTDVVTGPRSLLEAVYETGRKGLDLQRYKGLGEMNPEQLWETTLDPDVRTLLQVKVGDLAEADEIFAKLMGDVVEPRRDFIQENALNVSNLDV
jgi:DNA gyrase subunit B